MGFEAGKRFTAGDLKVHTENYQGVPLLICYGEADAHSVSALREALDYAITEACCQLVVDIRTLDYLDISLYSTLAEARKKLEEETKGTMVVIDLVESVPRMISLLGIDALMERVGSDAMMSVTGNLRQALAQMKHRPLRPPNRRSA